MSKTPVFDDLVAEYPKNLWQASNLFARPAHKSECLFDGYNWHVCVCGIWDTKTGVVFP